MILINDLRNAYGNDLLKKLWASADSSSQSQLIAKRFWCNVIQFISSGLQNVFAVTLHSSSQA